MLKNSEQGIRFNVVQLCSCCSFHSILSCIHKIIAILLHRFTIVTHRLEVLLGHASIPLLHLTMPQPLPDCSYVDFQDMLNRSLLQNASIKFMCTSSYSQLGHFFCKEWVNLEKQFVPDYFCLLLFSSIVHAIIFAQLF